MKTVLYMHGGSGNHGCEALVRSTAAIVKNSINSELVLWSDTRDEDIHYGVDKVVDQIVTTDELNKKTLSFLAPYFKFKVLKDNNALHDAFIRELFKDSIAISIGGDNYCYPWSAKRGVELDQELRKYCKKNVFWGCSVEEKFLTPEVVEDLKGFDLITVRESLSHEVLKKHGIASSLVADPAFLLKKTELPLPDGFIEGNTVGINVSPLINDYESDGNIAFENYVELINYIIKETDMNICLIPHVVWEYNNDFGPIDKLFDLFKDTGRVVKIGDHNCEEIKGFISKCRFFVGARTHSTIAAYSTCVPTLVVGYSIKAKGIAKDIFGSYEGYVIPVQEMRSKNDLADRFKFILANEEKIRKHLVNMMPDYMGKAKSAEECLLNLL